MYVELDGPEVRGMRREAGLTQRALATAAGLDRSTIGKAEKPHAVVTLHTARKVAAVLGVNPKELGRSVRARRKESR